MSTSTDFKILEIPVDGVNSYIPPIIINEADNNGRRLKFTPTYEGQPVTGITSARMYYDPRPRDASSIGDYVDGTKDGDGWVFVIPPNTFTAGVQGIASVSFTDADGETYTRSMPIEVESGGTKIDSQGTRIDRLIATLEQMVNDFTMTADTETGPAGSQASVNVTRLSNGSYKLDFTIPTGEKGPKGDPGDLTTVAHDSTLTGNGTTDSPLKIAAGSLLTQDRAAYGDLNQFTEEGLYGISSNDIVHAPNEMTDLRGTLILFRRANSAVIGQMLLVNLARSSGSNALYLRYSLDNGSNWGAWERVALISDVSALMSRIATLETKLETRVQAVEARIKSL